MKLLTVEQIKPENLETIRDIYEDFKNRAIQDYNYTSVPVEFDQFVLNIKEGILHGLVLFEETKAAGILIYTIEKHNALEVNIIHTIHTDQQANNIRYMLLEELTGLFREMDNCNTISYAMLGKQESFIRDISLLNFKLVGQSYIKFDFKSSVSFRIFKNAEVPELGNHSFSIWEDKYTEQVINLIHLSFKNNKNTNFDPRFLSQEGSKDVLNMILTGQYGAFLPSQSRLLLLDGNVEGFCLCTMLDKERINIPLIGVRKHTRNKGMGKLLMKNMMAGFIRLIGEKKISLSEINATTDTDNYPAIKMYRRLGFKEEYFYAHAYLKK